MYKPTLKSNTLSSRSISPTAQQSLFWIGLAVWAIGYMPKEKAKRDKAKSNLEN